MDENRDGFPEEAQDRQDHRAEAPLPDMVPPELFRQDRLGAQRLHGDHPAHQVPAAVVAASLRRQRSNTPAGGDRDLLER